MLKEFLIVSTGSFFGGGTRYVVSQWLQTLTSLSFPLGTFVVNVVGCLLIGFLSGLNYGGGFMTPTTKLLLTTGFCGGFTTFSTFVNEGSALGRDGNFTWLALYIIGSLAVGFLCLLAGNMISKTLL